MKCDICGKLFPDNVKDFDIYNHFVKEHQKELIETAKNIKQGIRKQKGC